MKTTIVRGQERGTANYGWLNANYSFSFGQYYNPNQTHFGKLRVLNDDEIAGGAGFATHPHANMEIITIPLQGALKHKDSTGASGTIRPNEVQVMSAGKGIEHSEKNGITNGVTKLLQIWIIPNQVDVVPRYNQQYFEPEQRLNKWQPLVSNKHAGALPIYQDAVLSRITLQQHRTISYQKHFSDNGLYLFVINGELSILNHQLKAKDAISLEEFTEIEFVANKEAEVLAIEVPMK